MLAGGKNYWFGKETSQSFSTWSASGWGRCCCWLLKTNHNSSVYEAKKRTLSTTCKRKYWSNARSFFFAKNVGCKRKKKKPRCRLMMVARNNSALFSLWNDWQWPSPFGNRLLLLLMLRNRVFNKLLIDCSRSSRCFSGTQNLQMVGTWSSMLWVLFPAQNVPK